MAMGSAAYAAAVYHGAAELSWLPVCAVLAGSLLPDIDHPRSTIGRALPFVSRPLAMLVGHRGVTHSLPGLAMVCLAFVYFVSETSAEMRDAFAWLACGYLVHVAADALTDSGVPLFWPMKKRFGVPLVTTGGILDTLLCAAAGVVCFGFGLAAFGGLA